MIRIKLIIWNKSTGQLIHHEVTTYKHDVDYKEEANKIYKLFPNDVKKQISIYNEKVKIKEFKNW